MIHHSSGTPTGQRIESMSHLTCTNCGQRSPDSATRCRHCGRAFGRPPQGPEDSGSRRIFSAAVFVAGAALIILAAYKLWPRFRGAPSAAPPETTTVAAPAPPSPTSKESRAAPVESVRAVAPSPSRPPVESRPPVADTARPVPPPPAPSVPVSIDPARQRYAQVWANLRAERSASATVIRVLHPGEVVGVDSLQEGWYRVVTDSGVGYVDQQYLDTLPPSARGPATADSQ